MGITGTLFGWAFGDPAREQENAYVKGLQDEALANATRESIVDVMPVLDKTSFSEPHLRIPAEAGYGV
ncbi:MAG: hypothetical protein ACLGIS_03800, partial [Actinomycetes bacterium]